MDYDMGSGIDDAICLACFLQQVDWPDPATSNAVRTVIHSPKPRQEQAENFPAFI